MATQHTDEVVWGAFGRVHASFFPARVCFNDLDLVDTLLSSIARVGESGESQAFLIHAAATLFLAYVSTM